MNPTKDFYGYVKLSGAGVEEGKIDLASASKFLGGIDKNLRFFISKDNPGFANTDFSLEVKIEPGSLWVYVTGLLITGSITIGTAYASKAAQKLAENDVGEKSTSDIAKLALGKMKSTIKIAKHLGGMDKKTVAGAKFKDNNQIIGLPNSKGEYLYVKKDEFDAFFAAPKGLYDPLANVVNTDTSLTVGTREEDGSISEEGINNEERPVFTGIGSDEGDRDLVLPELVEGEFVEIEGELTRGNARTNTFGFAYKDHILTCTLRKGNVRDFRQVLFGKVKIRGEITRHDQNIANEEEKNRPKIIFDSIEVIDSTDDQTALL